MIETHTHLYAEQFDEDRADAMQRAFDAGVKEMYLPAIDSETHQAMLALEAAYPDRVFSMMGLHPCSVKDNYEEELAIVKSHLDARPFCAIGEIGIDLHWDKTTFEIQRKAFKQQINWAKALNIPIIIHSRNSTEEVIEVLKEEKDERLRGIFHCFGGSVDEGQRIIDLGFYLGIGGVVTFKNAGLDKTVAELPLESLVLETDAPYLSPMPYRGKRNETSYLRLIAEKIAEVKGVRFAEIEEVTTRNAKNIFGMNNQNE
ncbi:MAG: TatD DNase family protein [Saprospiraceae bacterium]|jgi:TatD DNase family protein